MVMLRLSVEQFRKLPILADESTCIGKTYVVTGGNSGLGFETAKHLVEFSAACVVLGVRNLEAGEKAKREIEKFAGRKNVVKVWHVDMASNTSVKAFADRATTELLRIDGFVANAGIMVDQWSLVEGVESSITVNVINTLLLGVLMMPKLHECARMYSINPALIFIVSVLGYTAGAEIDKLRSGGILDKLSEQKNADMDARYALTKILLEIAARQFAAVCPVERTGVTITMVAPGLCTTGLGVDLRSFTKAAHSVLKSLMARTAEVGSRTILHGLVVGEAGHGKLLSGCHIKEDFPPSWVGDAEGQKFRKAFWDELVGRWETLQPGAVAKALA